MKNINILKVTKSGEWYETFININNMDILVRAFTLKDLYEMVNRPIKKTQEKNEWLEMMNEL